MLTNKQQKNKQTNKLTNIQKMKTTNERANEQRTQTSEPTKTNQ
jgi:hypothetical protein